MYKTLNKLWTERRKSKGKQGERSDVRKYIGWYNREIGLPKEVKIWQD